MLGVAHEKLSSRAERSLLSRSDVLGVLVTVRHNVRDEVAHAGEVLAQCALAVLGFELCSSPVQMKTKCVLEEMTERHKHRDKKIDMCAGGAKYSRSHVSYLEIPRILRGSSYPRNHSLHSLLICWPAGSSNGPTIKHIFVCHAKLLTQQDFSVACFSIRKLPYVEFGNNSRHERVVPEKNIAEAHHV